MEGGIEAWKDAGDETEMVKGQEGVGQTDPPGSLERGVKPAGFQSLSLRSAGNFRTIFPLY